MPRYAKKGTTIADIGEKLFVLLAAERHRYCFQDLEKQCGKEIKCFNDIPEEVAEKYFWDYALPTQRRTWRREEEIRGMTRTTKSSLERLRQ